MRLEIEFCVGIRNGDRAGLALAPAAKFAVRAVREAADRKRDLAATT